MATARSATGCSVPVVVESTHSAKVAAPPVVETASLPDVENSRQLDVDLLYWADTLAISLILLLLFVLECPEVAGKYLDVELERLLP